MPILDKSYASSPVTACRQHRQGIGYLLVQLFIGAVTPINLMKHLSILNKQHPPRMDGCFYRMGHHEDGLPFPVDFTKKPQKLIGRPDVYKRQL